MALKNTSGGGDIANSQGLDDVSLITNTTKDAYADKIAAALVVMWKQKQAATDDDNTVGLYVGDVFKQFITRNSIDQVAYNYQVGIYTDDPTGNLDPDDVVTG